MDHRTSPVVDVVQLEEKKSKDRTSEEQNSKVNMCFC
jgi:hypothetical protein